jgi:hypothetical protein
MNLVENFDYHDLLDQVDRVVSVDEYAAKIGEDDEIITIALVVKGQQASQDLVDWLERGYEWVMDAEVSEGEITTGKYVVFVEIARRTTAPAKIIELLSDLETLTDIHMDDWKVRVGDNSCSADEQEIKDLITTSPHEYRMEKDTELNEMRTIAGIKTVNISDKKDSLLKDYLAKAGL